MDLLVFDAKRNRQMTNMPGALNKDELIEMLGNRKVDAFLNGGLVQIFDETASRILYETAGIGQWLEDERKESRGVSRTCFSQEKIEHSSINLENTEDFKKAKEIEEMKWSDLSPICNILILSPLETVLLSIDWQILNVKKEEKEENALEHHDIWLKMRDFADNSNQFGKKYAVFRFLKSNGWIVTSGHTFGCDFLIYCLGAQFYHSSAGVLIADVIDPQELLTQTRILAHNKKALIMATTSADVENFEDLTTVDVKIVTMKTYFLERDVAQMSNRRNEVYELKCVD